MIKKNLKEQHTPKKSIPQHKKSLSNTEIITLTLSANRYDILHIEDKEADKKDNNIKSNVEEQTKNDNCMKSLEEDRVEKIKYNIKCMTESDLDKSIKEH